jgi:hypothetical protein
MYRLYALKPEPFYNMNPHHLLWNSVQMFLAKLGELLEHPTTVSFQVFGILCSCATLFLFFRLMCQASGGLGFAAMATLLVAFSPKFWFMTFQNQPYGLVFLTTVLFLAAWYERDGACPSGLRLLAAGFAIAAATLFHQAAAVLAPAGCLALILCGRGPLPTRLLRSLLWGSATAALVLGVYVIMGRALGLSDGLEMARWMTGYLETQHSLQIQLPESFAKSIMGITRSVLQTERLEWVLAARFASPVVLALYAGLGLLACGAAASLLASRRIRRRLRDLTGGNALFVVSLLSVAAWSAFVFAWEPAGYYWVLNLFPALVCLGLFLRGRAPRTKRVLAVVVLGVCFWNVHFNRDWDQIYARNFPDPLLEAIDTHVGSGDIFIVLGNRDWFAGMDYDLLFECLKHRGRNPGLAILNDLMMRPRGSRSWSAELRQRIESTLDADGRVFVARHVFSPDEYADLLDANRPFALYVKEQYLGIDGREAQAEVERVFEDFELAASEFKIGLDPYLEVMGVRRF